MWMVPNVEKIFAFVVQGACLIHRFFILKSNTNNVCKYFRDPKNYLCLKIDAFTCNFWRLGPHLGSSSILKMTCNW